MLKATSPCFRQTTSGMILKIIIDKTKKKRNNNRMHTIFTNTLNVVLVFNSN